jgi:predicted nucleic acid-binding protein
VNCYVDSSVVLRYLLGIDTKLEKALGFDAVGSSELLLIECPRVLDRYRLAQLLDDDALAHVLTDFRVIADGFHIIELTDAVKERAAEPFPTVIGTLDAIHLSSAALWIERQDRRNLTILTADRQMERCARAMGFAVEA